MESRNNGKRLRKIRGKVKRVPARVRAHRHGCVVLVSAVPKSLPGTCSSSNCGTHLAVLPATKTLLDRWQDGAEVVT